MSRPELDRRRFLKRIGAAAILPLIPKKLFGLPEDPPDQLPETPEQKIARIAIEQKLNLPNVMIPRAVEDEIDWIPQEPERNRFLLMTNDPQKSIRVRSRFQGTALIEGQKNTVSIQLVNGTDLFQVKFFFPPSGNLLIKQNEEVKLGQTLFVGQFKKGDLQNVVSSVYSDTQNDYSSVYTMIQAFRHLDGKFILVNIDRLPGDPLPAPSTKVTI